MNVFRLICSALLLAASAANAQNWYQVEVILFEHIEDANAEVVDPEVWPSDLSLDWPSPLLTLDRPLVIDEQSGIRAPYSELPRDSRSLNNDAYALRVRQPYRLLWHKAWQAPMLPEGQAPWIEVKADELHQGQYRLEGGVRIHLSRYLHLHTDLWLTCLLYTSPSPRDGATSRMPSSA